MLKICCPLEPVDDMRNILLYLQHVAYLQLSAEIDVAGGNLLLTEDKYPGEMLLYLQHVLKIDVPVPGYVAKLPFRRRIAADILLISSQTPSWQYIQVSGSISRPASLCPGYCTEPSFPLNMTLQPPKPSGSS